MIKNFKNIDKVIFGRGAFAQLGDIISEKRGCNNGFMLFVIDKYFKDKELVDNLPIENNDIVEFIDVNISEPTTEQVDNLRDKVVDTQGVPDGVIGIGGGSIMDIAKAVSLMFTNPGSSQLYQGLNLVKNPGIYHVGVPTVSGTGAECSMTAVLTGPEKKLGLKCDWTVFNQVVLDPDLIETVPKNQWFYTGMDTYIHNIEARSGIYNNAFSRAYGEASLNLCREIFLGPNAGQTKDNNEKLMIASLFGGLSLTYSEVGACHALSYGLGYVFHMRHGISNCIAFRVLEDFYGDYVKEFNEMVSRFNIDLPQNLSKKWSDDEIKTMSLIAYNLTHMWNHALGEDWKEKWTIKDIEKLYRRL